VLDLNEELGRKIEALLKETALFVNCDVSSEEDVLKAIKAVDEKWGNKKVGGVVNCEGVGMIGKVSHDVYCHLGSFMTGGGIVNMRCWSSFLCLERHGKQIGCGSSRPGRLSNQSEHQPIRSEKTSGAKTCESNVGTQPFRTAAGTALRYKTKEWRGSADHFVINVPKGHS
jgi:hypothetical protein